MSELKQNTKKLYVALDHGLSFPDMKGLEHPLDVLRFAAENEKVDGVIASLGVYRQAQKLGIDLSRKERLVLTDYAALGEKGAVLKEREVIVKPEETEIVSPDWFKMFLNVYEEPKELYRNCRDVEKFVVYGANHGIKTLAEIMFFGNHAFKDPHTQASELVRGCRIAMELGADALKIPAISDLSVINEVADTLQLPVYMLGGSKTEDYRKFLQQLQNLADCKVNGFMFGRNIWQSENMRQTVEDITAILSK